MLLHRSAGVLTVCVRLSVVVAHPIRLFSPHGGGLLAARPGCVPSSRRPRSIPGYGRTLHISTHPALVWRDQDEENALGSIEAVIPRCRYSFMTSARVKRRSVFSSGAVTTRPVGSPSGPKSESSANDGRLRQSIRRLGLRASLELIATGSELVQSMRMSSVSSRFKSATTTLVNSAVEDTNCHRSRPARTPAKLLLTSGFSTTSSWMVYVRPASVLILVRSELTQRPPAPAAPTVRLLIPANVLRIQSTAPKA